MSRLYYGVLSILAMGQNTQLHPSATLAARLNTITSTTASDRCAAVGWELVAASPPIEVDFEEVHP
jgi:hypothetical protein